MPEPIVNNETPAETPVVPENGWQPETPSNNEPVKTDETPTPEINSWEDFFNHIMKDILGEDTGTPETPKEEPKAPTPEVTPDAEKVKLMEELTQTREFQTKYKDIASLIEKDEKLAKFMQALSSGKITFSWFFEQYAKSLSGPSPAAPSGTTGWDSPKPRTLNERLASITRLKQTDENAA